MFSSRQLSEMLDLAENAREQLINDLASLGNESISAKVNLNSDKSIFCNDKFLILFSFQKMMGKYSMDSFMQMAMGINMNEELKDFRNFEDHPAVKVSEKFEIFFFHNFKYFSEYT